MSPYPAEPFSPRPTPIRHMARPELPVSLPLPPTSFVGRTRETDAISDLLRRDDTRLVTLTGPDGGSKIRLAIHIAEAVAHSTGLIAIPAAVITAASGRRPAGVRGIAHGEHVGSFGREGTCVWGAEARRWEGQQACSPAGSPASRGLGSCAGYGETGFVTVTGKQTGGTKPLRNPVLVSRQSNGGSVLGVEPAGQQ